MYSSTENVFCYSLEHAVMGDPAVDDATAQQVLAVLRAPESLRKRIAVRILHKKAEAYVRERGYGENAEAIDWTKIPWKEILVGLLKALLIILPFIL